MSSSPTVLVFAYPEHGQSNVHLGISYELALAGVRVYIASFPPLRSRVSRIQELIDHHALRSGGKPTGSVIFRECKGITGPWAAHGRCGINDANLPHPPGVSGALQSYSKLGAMLCPWSPEEYLVIVDSCKEIITTTQSDVVVVESVFYSALDACNLMNQKFMMVSPLALKDNAVGLQPYLELLWKYPVTSSGFPFPLKWWQIPLNIYLYILFIIILNASENLKRMQTVRGFSGLNNLFGVTRYPGVTHIIPTLAEIDLPFSLIPYNALLCGPIVVPFDPLEETDPTLMKWLDNEPTVMINLGSHVLSNEKLAREMASAFRILLDYHVQQGSGNIQVLWKAKPSEDIRKVIDDIIGKEIKEERVKVVAWLDVEPVSILQHLNLVCTVHHGGANSFYEGVWSGVPQIILPVWFDTYDNAHRVESLNIGIFGSKTCAPGAQAEELGRALVRVTGDSEEAATFRTSAKHVQEICRAKGNGRELASAAVLKAAIGVRKSGSFIRGYGLEYQSDKADVLHK